MNSNLTPDLLVEDDEPVHAWFELTYANYAVLHRTLLQSMPVEWQRRFVACMDELQAAFDHIEKPESFHVQPCEWREPTDLPEFMLRYLGISWPGDDAGSDAYYDRDGNELDPHRACVPVPVPDPVPHYNRGRTRIEPQPTIGEST